MRRPPSRSKGRPGARLALALALALAAPLFAAVLVVATSGGADAQPIYDPENPNAGGSGVIVDPENPNAGGSGVIVDPENPNAGRPRPTASPSPSLAPASAPVESNLFTPSSWFSGDYESRFYFDTGYESEREDVFLFQNRLELRARIHFSRDWRAHLEARLDSRMWGRGNPDGFDVFVNGEGYQGVFEASLRDAYLSGRFGNLFLKIGNQSVVWGAGTFTQPADVINPVDYRGGVIDTPANQRLPIFAVDARYVADGLGVEVVLVPFFTPHRFDLFGSDFAFFRAEGGLGADLPVYGFLESSLDPSIQPGLQDHLLTTRVPHDLPRNASAGARLTATRGGWDLGLGYFFGWDRTPFFRINEDLATALRLVGEDEQLRQDFDFFDFALRTPGFLTATAGISEAAAAGETLLLAEYRRRHTFEVDAVTYFGPIGVRLESAYTLERTIYLDGVEAARLPVLNNALALTYEDGEDFNIQVEGFYVRIFDIPRGREPLATGENYGGVVLGANLSLGAFAGNRGTGWEDLSFRFAGVAGITTEDWILAPSATWQFAESASLTAGAMIFIGPPIEEQTSIGGLFEDNDQAYFSIDAAF